MALLCSGKRLAKINRNVHSTACSHLTKVDPVLRRIIARVGPCTLRPRRQYFATLCDSIISQQLSTKVAEVISNRFVTLYAQRRPAPRAVARPAAHQLRAAALSGQKAKYLKDLAAGFLEGRIQPSRFARLSNEEIIAALVSLRGVGRWTTEMFLIFSLNRPNVLPVNNLGIKKAIRRWYGLRALPAAATIRKIGKPWNPYESIASWYLWKSLQL